MKNQSTYKASLPGSLIALLGLVFVVWTSVAVALPAQDDPVATAVALSDWQANAESAEGSSSPGDVASLTPVFVFPPLALNASALHQLAFEAPATRLLSYPGKSQAPPSLV
ncbi:hypothetical protein NLU14_02090 [Marinobacter sp. 71-i]|uniref:Uncharacterized protein n=1 Tax=Marinobacter iranensis TaxID=2962607 RepID=A0ABT5Y634_9GAMM|nr:hypothetical protein [Marinobacter iranensis]MDF0749014.1 hypothetical protein [Marinobacter iranensis]